MVRIMLVDENPVTRAMARKSLLLAGNTVVDAPSGDDALDTLGRAPIDVIVLDMVLPDMTGLELIERVRALPGHTVTPIVTMADADADDPTALAEMAGGSVGRVGKPCSPSELTDAVAGMAARFAAREAEDLRVRDEEIRLGEPKRTPERSR